MPEDKSIDSTPFVNSQGMTETRFDDSKPVSSGSANLQADKNRVKGWVKGMFEHFTGTRDARDLGRDDSRKEGDPVLTTDMGLIETGVSSAPIITNPSLDTPTIFEPVRANNTEKEDMAAAIAQGPNSATEGREAQVSAEEMARASSRQEEEQRRADEAKKNERVAADQTAYQAFQNDQQDLQHNSFNPTSWMEREASDTRNLKKGAAEAEIAGRLANGQLGGDALRGELFKTGNYEDLEGVEAAAQRIEERNQKDQRSKEPLFDEDLSPTPRLETSDRNSSVQAAEEDVAGHVRIIKQNQAWDAQDAVDAQKNRKAAGDKWIDAHGDKQSGDRISESDRNQSVLNAEEEVARKKRVDEYNRQKAEVEAAEAEKNRESAGRSWIDTHRDNAASERITSSDRNLSVQAAEKEVDDFFTKQRKAQESKDYDIGETGKRWSALDNLNQPTTKPIQVGHNQSVQAAEEDVAGHVRIIKQNQAWDAQDAVDAQKNRKQVGGRWSALENERAYPRNIDGSLVRPTETTVGGDGDDARDRIIDEHETGADEIAERIDAPIEDGEITVIRRQPLFAEPDTDPETTTQRQRQTERTQNTSSRWRRRLALVGMAALMLFAKDRGPANPPAQPGQPPVNEAPYVPMPEIGGRVEFSPLDALPKTLAKFPTEGPQDENIPTTKADLGEWFNAEWVKQYKQSHPGQFNDNGFDMRNAYDINLLNRLKHSESYLKARDLFGEYVKTHEIRNGDNTSTVNITEDASGKVESMIVSVPKQGGYQVPDIKAVYDLVNK